MGSNPGSVKFLIFFLFFFFFFSFSFFKYIESVLGSNIAPSPSPHPTFFHFLDIVQYLFVHCTIPSILGSHPPYPTSPLPPTLRSHPPFHKNFNSSFSSDLTPQPHPPDPPPPPQFFFFFEFSQKLQFFIHIHPDPPPPPPPPNRPPPP